MMAITMFGAGLRLRSAPAGLLALAVMCGWTVPAHAGVIGITANTEERFSGYGLFDGTVQYTSATDDGTGLLVVALTNMLEEAEHGFITGFIFNIGSIDPFARASLIEGPPVFEDALHQGNPHYGNEYDAGAALKGNFMGGGDPRKGIAPGESKSFTFLVTATDARQLTPESFLAGPYDHNFIVRFRGMPGAGVDIVPAMPTTIPGPSALAAMAMLLALSRWRPAPESK